MSCPDCKCGEPNDILNKLIKEGWTLASNPPDTDRAVQVAWDDGSTSETVLAFYDSKSTIPETRKKFWWGHPKVYCMPEGAVLAWKEIEK